jgi:muramidase (phage lysozyme)
MKFTAIIAAVLLTGYLYGSEDTRILNAIGQVETGNNPSAVGDGGKARGQYQMTFASWRDANMQLIREGELTYSFSQWNRPMVQDIMALAYLRVIRARLAGAGIKNPSIQQIALCWNMGFSAAMLINFDNNRAKGDYAERVYNIYATKN